MFTDYDIPKYLIENPNKSILEVAEHFGETRERIRQCKDKLDRIEKIPFWTKLKLKAAYKMSNKEAFNKVSKDLTKYQLDAFARSIHDNR